MAGSGTGEPDVLAQVSRFPGLQGAVHQFGEELDRAPLVAPQVAGLRKAAVGSVMLTAGVWVPMRTSVMRPRMTGLLWGVAGRRGRGARLS